jgi:DNA polymerase-3 subunit epsilon
MGGSDRYFRELEQIHFAMGTHQYEKALRLSYESLPLVPGFVKAWSREYGRFDITGIPCIEVAARFSAAQGDLARLEQLRSWACAMPELEPWLAIIDQRMEGARAQPRILELVRSHPGHLQSALPNSLGISGRVTGRLVVDMEYLGLLERIASGKSYELYLPGSAAIPTHSSAAACVADAKPTTKTARVPAPRAPQVRPVTVDPTDTWIALDFETATSAPESACALGVAVVQHGAIVSSGAWLIQPPDNQYAAQNIAVHGITPRHTKRSPSYGELYAAIAPFLADRYVLAHWASFDISVLRALHSHYGISLPNTRYACSCRMAQRAFPRLGNHRLPTVCDHCGIPLRHHDAASDAIACAQVALNCRDHASAASIHEALSLLGLQVSRL